MFWRTVSSLGLVAMALSIPVPDPQHQGGFRPLEGARGPNADSGYGAPAANSIAAPAPSSGPSKTIYVNVPAAAPAPAPQPVAAGPPRKHYKIVFIRAPAPPPAPQPILPPRTEQKTLIYVLHQRPQAQQQEVIEVPTVKHSPEVYFVQYDNPPTAEELQQLTAGDLGGLPYSPPGLDGQLRSLPEAGAGSPNLILADEAALGAVQPADAPVFFEPQPVADSAPAADAAPLIIVDPAPAAPSVGVPLQDAPAPAEPAAPVLTPITVAPAPAQVGVPLTASGGSAPNSFGVPLSQTVGVSPGRAGVGLDETLTPGGSTIAAGVGGAVAPETFPFELGDAFGQRTVQRR